jgi:hypothetical protein
MKVLKDLHKGKEVYICGGLRCGTVVESLHPSKYFPQGYHFDVCPKCKAELNYNDLVKLETLILTKEDHEVLAKWAKEKFKS